MDLEEDEIRAIPGLAPETANVLIGLINELTVEVEDEYDEAETAPGQGEE